MNGWKQETGRLRPWPVLMLTALLLFAPAPCPGATPAADSSDKGLAFDELQKRLIRDRFAPDTVRRLFQRPDVRFEIRHVSSYFIHRESTLNYDQYLAPALIAQARNYLKTYTAEMDAAEKEYDVDRRIIAAILLVETRLGAYQGKSPVMNTLATMAALSDPDVRERFWEALQGITNMTRTQYEERIERRSDWAYRELKAFIRYTTREGIDPGAVKGSYAGAMGIPQFMPSNALTLGIDGDGDGAVDLFNHADAIASVANYLKHKGWQSDISREKAYEVILRYNYSRYYANTILRIWDSLKE